MPERVQKLLSQWGIASRRQAEQMILAGRVRLNGNLVQLGQKIQPEVDRVEVDGKVIAPVDRPDPLYLMLNKPAGVVSTCYDPQHRTTVLDLLPPEFQQGQGLHLVGRLDVESTGALLLTNDGELTFQLTHPRHHVPKTYQVWLEGLITPATLQRWQQGVWLDDRRTLPAQVHILDRTASRTWLEIILKEGRNRQIRRVAELLGHPVVKLHRTAIGNIQLQLPHTPLLPTGHYRSLENFEVNTLKLGNPSILLGSQQTLRSKAYE